MTEHGRGGYGAHPVDRPGSAGTHHFYHNHAIAQVSWVNLADSERGSSDHDIKQVDRDLSEVSLIQTVDMTSAPDSTADSPVPPAERYPEYAYVRDKRTGKRVFYKRVDEYDVLLDSIQTASNRVGVALLVASNLVIFALGYHLMNRR